MKERVTKMKSIVPAGQLQEVAAASRRRISRGRLAFVCALACCLSLSFYSHASAQRRSARRQRPASPAVAQAPAAAPTAARQEFEQVAAQAAAARDGDRGEGAIGRYPPGRALPPDWTG